MPESHTAGSHAASFRTVTASSRLTSGLRTEEDAQCTPTIIVQLVLSCLRLFTIEILRCRYIFSGESFPTSSGARLVQCQVRKWPFVTFSRPTHYLSQKLFSFLALGSFSCEHKFGKISLK